MKKRIRIMLSLILLSQLFLLPISASEAGADTRITITFAAGGVAGGIYFFLRLTFKASAMPQYTSDATALFNYDSEGWQIEYPEVKIMRDEVLKMYPSEHSSETAQVEILKIRF